MRVRQALPFLELQGGLRDRDGRRAKIGAIAIEMDGKIPNLVLDLIYELDEEGTEADRRSRGGEQLMTRSSVPAVEIPALNDYAPVVFRTPTVAPGEERISSERVALYGPWEELIDRFEALRSRVASWFASLLLPDPLAPRSTNRRR